MAAIYRFFHPCVLAVHPDYKDLECFIKSLSARFLRGEGVVIHKGRNELRKMECGGRTYVVKSFHQPNLINRFIYGIFRASKAKRSYLYAKRFLELHSRWLGWMNVPDFRLIEVIMSAVCPHVLIFILIYLNGKLIILKRYCGLSDGLLLFCMKMAMRIRTTVAGIFFFRSRPMAQSR